MRDKGKGGEGSPSFLFIILINTIQAQKKKRKHTRSGGFVGREGKGELVRFELSRCQYC